jgi:hypothetical protein
MMANTKHTHILYIASDAEELKAGFYFINETRQFENEEPFATYEECLEALENYKRSLK